MRGGASRVGIAAGIAGLGVLAGCGAGAKAPGSGHPATTQRGRQAYQSLGCGSCHGDHREGKRSGPVLAGLADHWTQDRLVHYLKDPQAMVKTTPRLAYKAERYPIAMPSFGDKANQETLEALAAYLLTD